jgi:ABC-type uncharacterized transport system auxiliary subunit
LIGRRAGLLGLGGLAVEGLAGCSVLPDRPYQETQRFALLPERPQRNPASPRAPVLLIRAFRAAPGLDLRGLRSLGADGRVTLEYWAEWAAPPADLAEEALRRWLAASGRFGAITAAGSRVRSNYVLEGELVRLQAEPAAGVARAGLSLLLMSQDGMDEAKVLAPILADGSAPLTARAPEALAAAMTAALGAALAMAERAILGAMGGTSRVAG